MYCGRHDVAGNHGANGVDDDSGTVANNTCGHDDGAHYDGSVNASASASASARVDDCVSCIDDDDDDDDDSGADDSCGHDDGAYYDGSVFGDVQGCKLLGSRILRAVLWIQAGQHGGLSAS